MKTLTRWLPALAAAVAAAAASPAHAQSCSSDPSGFPAWLGSFKQEAVSQGIAERVVDATLDGVTFDANTLSHDHGQGVFHQSFEQFSGRMANSFRINKGRALVQRYGEVFDRIERTYGVPAPVITAIWGLETDFGGYTGKFDTIRSLATLAYDCRRSEKFRAELLDALRIVQRGDMSRATMRGAWAGEIGQTQFMPSSYVKFAVDFDGSGRRDLVHNVPDVLASTANYLKSYGWQAGQGWDPGQPNFAVIQQWNASAVYSRTIALLADKIAGKDYRE